ncbi:calmodulin-like protein 5 [Solanum lycopersicum]|uniref:calmodulin-like protein 5 n=1 Tax=Solanum lycopersicum TaxID=4081 RepID=UPI003747D374
MYDSNGDNYLNKEELKKLFQQLGSNAPRWRAARAIHHADKNGDGRIDMSTMELDQLVEYARKHGDGYLTKEDLTEAFRQLGSTFPGYRAGRALHRADKNGDGLIDKKELDKLVEYARKRGYRLRNACSN